MSDRYKLVQLGNRGGMFYYKDTQTGARKSLKTKDRKAAEKAVFHMNEAAANPHASRKIGLGGSLGALLDHVVARYLISTQFNLVKFRTDELKLSFLAYPDFETDAHPALTRALTLDLVTGKARHTDYTSNLNPPILHGKETFLPEGHPLRGQFEELTKAEEAG